MPAVSVIVPVYNTPKAYLESCVDSVLNQTFNDFELILVDDGSSDECGQLCDEMAKNDSRIIVLHQSNKGVSAARNLGMHNSSGKYTLFLDSDDSLDSKTLSCLHAMAETNSSEIVLFGYKQNGIEYSLFDGEDVSCLDENLNKIVYESTVVPRKEHGILLCGVCCKFYLTDLLRKQNSLFLQKLTSAEDQIFFLSLLNVNPRMAYCAESFYEYRYVQGSASFSYTPLFSEQVLLYAKELNDLIAKCNLPNKEVLHATRMCQCILYCLSKDFFHKKNPLSLSQKKRIFNEFASQPENRNAIERYDKEIFSLTERIGLWMFSKKLYWLIKIASLRW